MLELKGKVLFGCLLVASVFSPSSNAQERLTIKVPISSFGIPRPILDDAKLDAFVTAHELFQTAWKPPGEAHDQFTGLGPYYMQPSCAACHQLSGRGAAPNSEAGKILSSVIRLENRLSGDAGDPVYGHHLQCQAVAPLAAKGCVSVQYAQTDKRLSEGNRRIAASDLYGIQPGLWRPARSDNNSVRTAPSLIGLGYLEAVGETEINRAIKDYRGGGGGGGKFNRSSTTDFALGRFGWKASQASLAKQIAEALFRIWG